MPKADLTEQDVAVIQHNLDKIHDIASGVGNRGMYRDDRILRRIKEIREILDAGSED